MGRLSRENQVRVYKTALTVLVMAVVVGLLYGVSVASSAITENLEKTNCNQGMLVYRLTGLVDREKLGFCSPEIQEALRRKGILT